MEKEKERVPIKDDLSFYARGGRAGREGAAKQGTGWGRLATVELKASHRVKSN